jgi:LysR family hydrogen peroxide-inducible transcriptional activator
MEINQLRYFVAVAELSSFTRAAKRSHISQPSLSQQIAKLEREMAQPLFERLGRQVKLTEPGRALYERVIGILRGVDEAKAVVSGVSGWESGELSVGAIMTVAPYFLPDLVRSFLRKYPKARPTVRESFTQQIVKDCVSGELDVGLVVLPIKEERLVIEPLFSEELLLAFPVRHKLLNRKRITLEELSKEAFVLLDEMHCLGEQMVSFCRQNECLPVVACKTAQLLTVQEMVGLGQGVSLVPTMAAHADRNKKCVYRSLGPDAPRRTLAMIWHQDRFRSRLAESFVGMLRQSKAKWNCPR